MTVQSSIVQHYGAPSRTKDAPNIRDGVGLKFLSFDFRCLSEARDVPLDLQSPSARPDSGQGRGDFRKQTSGHAGYFELAGRCGDRCGGLPDDSDNGRHAIGLDELDRECVGTVDGTGGQDG